MSQVTKRLNHAAETDADIEQYYLTRDLQMRPYGFKRVSKTIAELDVDHGDLEKPYCYVYIYINNGKMFFSYHLPMRFRGKGYTPAFIERIKFNQYPVITINDCGIVDWLSKNNIPHVCIKDHYSDMTEYTIIEGVYGDQKAKRSGLYLMNHVDEGLDIMLRRKAMKVAQQAFTAHPLLQDDEHFINKDLSANLIVKHCSKEVILLCMEYRKVANAYLCKPKTDHWTLKDIAFACPIVSEDIREMLIADKVQNYKDFLQYHALTHPRRNQLFSYFNNWITYLECEEFAQQWIADYKTQLMLPRG